MCYEKSLFFRSQDFLQSSRLFLKISISSKTMLILRVMTTGSSSRAASRNFLQISLRGVQKGLHGVEFFCDEWALEATILQTPLSPYNLQVLLGMGGMRLYLGWLSWEAKPSTSLIIANNTPAEQINPQLLYCK